MAVTQIITLKLDLLLYVLYLYVIILVKTFYKISESFLIILRENRRETTYGV